MEHHHRWKLLLAQILSERRGEVSAASAESPGNPWKYGVFLSTFDPKLAPALDAVQGLTQVRAGRERR